LKSKPSRLIVGPLLVVVIVLVFGGGFVLGSSLHARDLPGLDIVGQAWSFILADYVDSSRLDTAELSGGAIQGMVAALDDPYTAYLPPADYELGLSDLEGEFDGIGATVAVRDGQLVIVAPFAGSPAERAGIRAGDVILAIDGEPAGDITLAAAIVQIRGQSGTTVRLTVVHPGETDPVDIEVVRAGIEVPSVTFEMKDDVAYIRIDQFSGRTDSELTGVIRKLEQANAAGIILDLRGNPGGLLDSVVAVAGHFITDGAVVRVRDNRGQITTMDVAGGDVTTALPMVVLVDGGSASGSEVLAGALQDHDRALVAGNVTYGKGSVNILRQLGDGSGLYITTARWLTPGGRLIEGQGIDPDVRLDVTGDEAVQWAIDFLSKNQLCER
jgi:carboxyl-terminal processing protease